MKHHLVLKLAASPPGVAGVPSWPDAVGDKTRATTRLEPSVDRAIHDAGLAFWTTHEYRPAGTTWSDEEVRHGLDRTYRLVLRDAGEPGADLLARLQALPTVDEARGTQVVAAPLPTPGQAPFQPSRRSTPGELIYLPYARAVTRGDRRVRIAILDTGVDADHPELRGKIGEQADFVDLAGMDTRAFVGDVLGADPDAEDELGHGTHVAGIVAARGLHMDEGVAPECTLLAVRVLASMRQGDRLVGAGLVDNINSGIKWAVDHGAHVINMSLGVRHEGGDLPHRDVIAYALDRGVTVVAASGNDGTAERYYPGALPGVVAVGAVDPEGQVTGFTSYGAPISVVAPGVNVHSSYAHGGYAVASGTSQASPFVAAGVGLLRSFALEAGRRLAGADVLTVLRETSDRGDRRRRTERAGYGLINLTDSMKLLSHEVSLSS